MKKNNKALTNLIAVVTVVVIVLLLWVAMSGIREVEKDTLDNGQFVTIKQTDDIWLQYDRDTEIVFMVQKSSSHGRKAYVRIPYPADNGLPYKYNKETQSLEKIVQGD